MLVILSHAYITVTVIVPLPFLLVAVGYIYDWDIRKFSPLGHNDRANQSINAGADKTSGNPDHTGIPRLRRRLWVKKRDDQDGEIPV